MSSLLANLEMSLDDIISQKKSSRKNPDARPVRRENTASSSGPIRNKNRRANRRGAGQPYARRVEEEEMMDVEADTSNGNRAAAKRKAIHVKQPGNKKVSILSRLGGKTEKPTLGTKILVKNLKHDILEDDVKELFGTVGKVNQVEIVYDASGRSKGIARVWFLKAMDAEKAIKQYDGRTLDGQAMTIILDEKNVRSGLFGTALESGRDNDKVQFKVNLGGNNGPRKGGRNGGRGGGRRRDGGSKTTQDLDNEMDTYMNDA